MTKSTLISITLVAAAVAAALAYQGSTFETGSVEATHQQLQQQPQQQQDEADAPVAVQASSTPPAPMSVSAPKAVAHTSTATQSDSERVTGSQAATFVAPPDAKPSAVNDPSHPPRQAINASRAPIQAPNANPEYADYPRPGTKQPISAPVSMSPPAPVK